MEPTTSTPEVLRPRGPLIALGLAGAALALAVITTVVVLTRHAPTPSTPTAPAVPPPVAGAIRPLLETRTTTDALLATMAGTPFTDATGRVVATDAAALGLAPGDVIVSVGGRPARRAAAVTFALRTLVREQAPALLFEIERGGAPAVVRVAVAGDLVKLSLDMRRPRPAASAPAAPGAPGLDLDDLAAGITKLDDEHYQITRAAIDAVVADPMTLARGGRVVPSVKNGTPDGLKLYAIRPGSLLALLGFVNGDTVHRVNGDAVDSMDRALDVYAKLRVADKIEFELTRRGRPVTLVLEVQ
ncbi:MAG: hypothetical protein IPL61_21660 [Myxococcales bacterium]|nr:hypothetical protein [Myxococcales bacterium]